MSAHLRKSGRSPFEECQRLLGQVEAKLKGRLAPRLYRRGWTDCRRKRLLALVLDWEQDLTEDGKLQKRHFRIANRWFLDEQVKWKYVEKRMARVDEIVDGILRKDLAGGFKG